VLTGLMILGILFFLRTRNKAVNLLPRAIKKHHIHYTRFPLLWEKRGEGASLSFIRSIRNDSKDMNKLNLLWEIMGGSMIEIEEAFAVHTPHQLINFANKWASTVTQVKNNPKLFINQKWKENGEELRLWVHEQYLNKVKQFPWNENLLVPIIPAIHGTDENVAYSIITTSFVALAKGDAGYYGKGLYFTTSAEYALPYFATKPSPTVLICYLITGNSYPVIEHPKSSKQNLMGGALMPNFQSHYVLCRIDGMPIPDIMDHTSEDSYYDEIVIEQESAVVPFYLLKIKRDNLLPLVTEIQKRQEKLVREDEHRDSLDIMRTSSKNRSTNKSAKIKLREDEIGRSKNNNKESARNNRLKEVSDSSSSSEEMRELPKITENLPNNE